MTLARSNPFAGGKGVGPARDRACLRPGFGGPPKLQEHGREQDLLVKQDGKWLIEHRVVTADSAMPESFPTTYDPRPDYDITADK